MPLLPISGEPDWPALGDGLILLSVGLVLPGGGVPDGLESEPVAAVEPVEGPEGIAPDWVPPEPDVPGMPAPAASLPDGPE